MPNKIEKLQQENQAIKQELDVLKTMAQSSEKEKKKSELDARIQKMKQEAQTEYQQESDQNTREKIKAEQEKLETFSSELNALWTEVTTTNTAPVSQEHQSEANENPQPSQEEKWVWGKTKDFVSEQWKDVRDKEKRKEEGGKNALRTAWFLATGVGAVALAYKGIKSLFGSDEDEEVEESEKSEETSKKKKKKGFRKTTFWKILKWTGIGAGVGTAGYYLGKWFWWWGNEDEKPTDTATDKEKLSAYEEFIKNPENKEKFENYEELGRNVDTVYEGLYQRELSAGYQDELEMQRIAKEQSEGLKNYKGIVPFCLDNKFGSVQAVLEQNTSISNALRGGITAMKSYINELGADFMQSFADSYLSKLPSWVPYIGKGGSLFEKLDKWALENKNAEKELAFFFRQSIRIQTYLFEKRDQLKKQVVARKAQETGLSTEQVLSDPKLWENDQQYQLFLSSSIVDGAKVLRNNKIFDATIGEKVKESVVSLDKERDKILGNKQGEKDILQVVAEKKQKNESLTPEEVSSLSAATGAMAQDIEENVLDIVEESAWNAYGDLLGTEDSALRKYLDQAWLREAFLKMKQELLTAKEKLSKGELNTDQILGVAETINNLLALKKEALLGRNTIKQDIDENGNIVMRIPGFLGDTWTNTLKSCSKFAEGKRMEGSSYLFASAGITLVTVGGVLYMIPWTRPVGKFMVKNGTKLMLAPATLAHWVGKHTFGKTKWGERLADKIKYWSPQWVQRMTVFRGEEWPDKLLHALKSGDISLEDAEAILKKKINALWMDNTTRQKWRDLFDVPKDIDFAKIEFKNKLFDKFVHSYQSAGNDFLKKIKAEPELYAKMVEHFDTFPEVREAIRNDKPIDELKKLIGDIDGKLSSSTASSASNIIDDGTEAVSDVIKNSPVYKQLDNDLTSELRKLEVEAEKALKSGNNAKYKQVNKQIDQLDNFRKQILVQSEKELNQTSDLLKLLKNNKSLSHAIDQLTLLKKLESQKFIGSVLDSSDKPIERSLDDVIKALDDNAIRWLKGKVAWITNDAIEELATTIKTIKSSHSKQFFSSIDEVATGIKTLVKFLVKAS